MTLKPFPPPVTPIAPHVTPQLGPKTGSLEGKGSQSFGKPWRLQRRSSESKLSGRCCLHPLSLTSHAPSMAVPVDMLNTQNGFADKLLSADPEVLLRLHVQSLTCHIEQVVRSVWASFTLR